MVYTSKCKKYFVSRTSCHYYYSKNNVQVHVCTHYTLGTHVLTGLASRQVKSTTDTSAVGTRKAIPVNLLKINYYQHSLCLITVQYKVFSSLSEQVYNLTYPFREGITFPTAFAAPVVAGIIF